MEDNLIFILPVTDKPIKIIFEEYPCPNNPDIRCKYSEFITEDMNIVIQCSNKDIFLDQDSCELLKYK